MFHRPGQSDWRGVLVDWRGPHICILRQITYNNSNCLSEVPIIDFIGYNCITQATESDKDVLPNITHPCPPSLEMHLSYSFTFLVE